MTIFPLLIDYVPMSEVIAAYPKGLDFRDVAWMYKRLLSGLGFVAEMGVVHGAILPSHVLVHPTGHGAKIIDWSYSLNFAALLAPKAVDPDPAPAKPAKGAAKQLNVWDLVRQNLYADPASVDPTIPAGPPPDPNKMYVKAISVDYQNFYAPEILRKETPSPSTDIYMAAKCAVALLGGDVGTNQLPASITPAGDFPDPDKARAQLQAFLQLSLLPAQNKRPHDPWQVEEAFDKLLRMLVGERRYRPFTMPSKGAAS